MTAQQAEILVVDNQPHSLRSLPLEDYLESRGISVPDLVDCSSSSLHRGYVGIWELAAGSLYMIGLADACNRPIRLEPLFGDRKLPIKADWFTGRLELPEGEQLTYFHHGWASQFPRVLRLYFKNGEFRFRRAYDQVELMRRRIIQCYGSMADFKAMLVENSNSERGPIGGFTRAGFRALEIPDTGEYDFWLDSDDDEEYDYAREMMAECAGHLVRP